ncbi:MAG: protein tyrosine phosphatase family protein [Gammaproteobacteria bacterium]
MTPLTSVAQRDELAINHVVINDRLHTSGQPERAQLSSLADRGFEMVINLAPPTTQGAIATEGQLVAENGIAYVNIPVDWRNPTYADFALFSGVLNQSGDRQVLVHCQVNKRASMFTFLYQVVHEQVPVDEAFEFVKQVWVPEDQWVTFGKSVLDRHDVASDIL